MSPVIQFHGCKGTKKLSKHHDNKRIFVFLLNGCAAFPVAVLGIILPIYTIIDMVETAENVWSDSCVAAIVNKRVGDTI